MPSAGLRSVPEGSNARMEADRSQTEHEPNRRRVTVAEAAEILGITAEAV